MILSLLSALFALVSLRSTFAMRPLAAGSGVAARGLRRSRYRTGRGTNFRTRRDPDIGPDPILTPPGRRAGSAWLRHTCLCPERLRPERLGISAGTRRRPRRADMRWKRPARPIIPPPIPRPAAVIPVPIAAEGERDDGYADDRAVRQQRYRPARVRIGQAAGVNPAATVVERDIAPAVIGETAHDLDRRVGWELRHQRITAIRPGAHIREARGERLLSQREGGEGEQKRGDPANSHGVPQFGSQALSQARRALAYYEPERRIRF